VAFVPREKPLVSNPNLRRHEKALMIRLRKGKFVEDLLQIAKVEGAKLLKCKKVRVTEFFHSHLDPEKFVVVVQNGDVAKGNMKQ
jgi:hypothetical protein